ncbi:MAG: bifunctional methylenetetrahydrofolate dehydrogenase/methenyltetrahydrofolate cyclohydrolase FolD [Rhodothalassiaceae bacterium]
MAARLIDGRARANHVLQALAEQTERLRADHGLTPGLAVVLVGDHPASAVYVRNKVRQAGATGLASFHHALPADTEQTELLTLIAQLNADPAVHGILVQLPLPGQIDAQAVLLAIDPAKDVDGFHPMNMGALITGTPGLVPCTPLGCLTLLQDVHADMTGLDALVVGRSNIVGKPMAQLLLQHNCTVTIAHSKSRDLPGLVARADILVAAVGRPQMIEGDWIKPGATVIDVGINRAPAPDKGPDKTRLVGDVAFEAAQARAGAITPVPGGVGPMTIASLLANTVTAAKRQAGIA